MEIERNAATPCPSMEIREKIASERCKRKKKCVASLARARLISLEMGRPRTEAECPVGSKISCEAKNLHPKKDVEHSFTQREKDLITDLVVEARDMRDIRRKAKECLILTHHLHPGKSFFLSVGSVSSVTKPTTAPSLHAIPAPAAEEEEEDEEEEETEERPAFLDEIDEVTTTAPVTTTFPTTPASSKPSAKVEYEPTWGDVATDESGLS